MCGLALTLAACGSDSTPNNGDTPTTKVDMRAPVEVDMKPTLDMKPAADMRAPDMKVPEEHPSLLETSPEDCAECHVQHFDDWEGSMHAYATKDPVFQAMLAKGVADTNGKLDQFCIQCHAPVASKIGQTPVVVEDGKARMDLDMENPIIGHGVVCVTCHATESVQATVNAEFTLSKDTLFGPTGSQESQGPHKMEQSDLLSSSLVCGSCHNVVNPNGALIENTFSEWYAGPFNSGNPETDKSCQDCHMPVFEGEIVPETEKTIHRHRFVGVDVALIDDFPDKEEQFQLVDALLKSVAELKVQRVEDKDGKLALRVDVTNANNGHALPSGSTADRQVWVHLQVHTNEGDLVFESGMFDANGDLMDRVEKHSLTPDGDPELLVYGSFMFDAEGNHVNFPWEAHRSQDFLLQPGQTGWREYLIEKEKFHGASGLIVTATLKYRTFPPFIIRILKEEGHLAEDAVPNRVPVVEMATRTIMLNL